MVEQRVTGNYEMHLLLTGELTDAPLKVFFSGDTALGKTAYLAISTNAFKIVRETGIDTRIWKTYNNVSLINICLLFE